MVEIRTATADEQEASIEVFLHAMGEGPDEPHGKMLQALAEPGRIIGGFDPDGRVVAGALSMETELAVPTARSLPAGLVTSVGVLPTHTRQGMLRRLMEHQLRDLRDRGEVVAVLRATEAVIYGRFGYGPMAPEIMATLPRSRSRFREPVDVAGRLRLLDNDEAVKILPAVHDRLWSATPGEVRRPQAWWDVVAASFAEIARKTRVATLVHEDDDGTVDGYIGYVISTKDHRRDLAIHSLYAVDEEVRAALVAFCLDIDLVRDVSLRLRPNDPLHWRLADPRALSVSWLGEGPWLRLVDVPAALRGRDYAIDGTLVIEVDDQLIKQNSGRWELTTKDGEATCRATEGPADLVAPVAALASCYIGGTAPSTLVQAGRMRASSPEAVAVADGLFRSIVAPFSQTDI